ncbi:hypothetical protein [Saccharolobus shibatae]|uniref:Uncharacterized protein n=1 Tax=Saccharolobus shibatae TaxID=2286 RepID=A0A8F5BZI3_9CREN|nr:hypothetical protein [Saccharolobus shibatae]QXJ34256.1 hypothetical protein J5U22_00802 [Saccharolobus shibatae]
MKMYKVVDSIMSIISRIKAVKAGPVVTGNGLPPPTGNSRKTRERVKPSITREKQHKPTAYKGIKTPFGRLAVKPLERSNKRG